MFIIVDAGTVGCIMGSAYNALIKTPVANIRSLSTVTADFCAIVGAIASCAGGMRDEECTCACDTA
jgi:hypothetical protein